MRNTKQAALQYIGDCIEVMRTLAPGSADCIITDPPYCSGGFTEASRRSATKHGQTGDSAWRYDNEDGWIFGDNMGTMGLVYLLRSMMVQADRILAPGRSVLVFCDWRMVPALAPALESTGFRWSTTVVWNKGYVLLGNGFRNQHEFILHFTKGSGDFYSKTIGNVITCKPVAVSKRIHPNQKPVKLIQTLIDVACPPGGTVLDPFQGSGVTGSAALSSGRKFIGIDKDGYWIKQSEPRLNSSGVTGLFGANEEE